VGTEWSTHPRNKSGNVKSSISENGRRRRDRGARQKKRLPLLEMLSALAWKTVVTCGGNTPPGSHFSVRSGWPALPDHADTHDRRVVLVADVALLRDRKKDPTPARRYGCNTSRGGGKEVRAGSNTTHKKRNTRMHMRLGPNTNRGAHTPPQPTSPKPHQRQQRPCPGMFSRSKEVPAIPRPWLA